MVYKMVTAKTVIAKIIADLGLEEDKIKISDIREWIGEANSKIGSVSQKQHKVVILPLEDYQCKLPCDLESIDIVAYSDNKSVWSLMKKTTGGFSVFDKEKYKINLYGQLPLLKETDSKDKIENTFSPSVKVSSNSTCYAQYDIKPGYLISNARDGFVKLSYYAEHTDEDGMPLIPNIPSYSEAIYWYVAMKLLYIEYFTGKKPQHLYYDAKRSWNFYRQQAYAESLMPDSANEVENIKNTWHTLIPEVNEIDTFFYNTGDEQLIYNAN